MQFASLTVPHYARFERFVVGDRDTQLFQVDFCLHLQFCNIDEMLYCMSGLKGVLHLRHNRLAAAEITSAFASIFSSSFSSFCAFNRILLGCAWCKVSGQGLC